MRKSNTKVILYVRVSSHEQALEGYSIGEQTDRLRSYSAAMGWTVVKVYTDPGYTGANMERPGLKELIRDVEHGRADKVVVYKLDRLSRSQKDTLYLIEDVLLKNHTDFVSMSENFDTATPFGRAIIGILAVFAQLERETIKERVTMGREARAKSGYYNASWRTLTGYDYIDGLLEVNDYEATLVREIFGLFNSGMALKTIADALNKRGLYHRDTKWSATTVRRVLSNRHYIGEVKFSRRWYPGRQEPIIDKETFERAQRRLEMRADSYASAPRGSAPLSGLVYCGRCGGKYHLRYWKPKKDGTKSANYICYSRSKALRNMIIDPNCKNRIYKKNELEGIVFGEIRKLGTDPDYLDRIRGRAHTVDDAEGRAESIKKEIESLSAQISKYMDLYALNRLTLSEVDNKIARLADKRERLEANLADMTRPTDDSLGAEEAEKLISSFGDILDRGSADEIRLVLTALIRRIVITDDEVAIYWNFS